MRQRKIKNLDEKMLNYQRFFVSSAQEHKGNWRSIFGNENELYLEVGSGKGRFLTGHAAAHRDRNYIGIEGKESVVLRALQKLGLTELINVRFARMYVYNLTELFAEGEVSGVYLNFSDPWPKKAHSHRRLTHRNFLEQYRKILKPGGFIEIKTDSEGLFNSTLTEISEAFEGVFEIEEITEDLHKSEYAAKNIMTEYEEKFISAGIGIKYIKLGTY
jgi:tRNA (guanine-N7-)-methyltransferase